jgi:hypothetical protein
VAYRKEQHEFLSGSLSYLPPGDQLAAIDALALTNVRVDTAGDLKSRQGSTAVYTVAGTVRALIKALGIRYQGSTSLYRAGASVASGFDGEPLGFAAYKKWLWVMNRSSQVKDNGTNNRNWSITAPTGAPTVAPATEITKTVTTFDSSETWTVSPSGDDSFDGSEKQEGSASLSITATDENTYTITRTVSLDLSTFSGTAASDDDKHRIWIYANKFKKLEQIIIQVDVNGGDFKTDYYEAVIPRKLLKKAGKHWKRFQIRKRQLQDSTGALVLLVDDPQRLPFFTRTGATSGKDWSTVAAVRIILDTRAAGTFKFDLWEVFGSVNGTIEAEDVQYYYTYANDDEHESNPSPANAAIAFNRTGGALSGLTASADPQVTKKYIYRTSSKLEGKVYRVSNTGVPNATTTYTDTASDETITALGEQMATDNDPAPAARGVGGPYLGRAIAYSTSTDKARFFWSKLYKFYAFPGSNLNSGNWQDIGDTGEEIIGHTMRPRMFLFYKENSIWRLIGDPDDIGGEIEVTRAQLGLLGNRAVCMAGEVDYFQGKEGIYRFNGDTATKISDKLDPIFKGQTVTLASGVTVSPVSAANRDKACLEFKNGRLYYSYPEEGQSSPNTTLVYDIASERWFRDSIGFSALNYEGQNGELVGARTADIVTLETGTTDSGVGIPVTLFTRYFRGNPDLLQVEKTWEDLVIDCDPGGATLTVTAFFDGGASSAALGTITTAGQTVLSFNGGLGLRSTDIAIRITGTGSAIQIKKIILHWYPEAREGKSFDTDETALGGGKMCLVREAQLDLDNAGDVTLTIRSDHPGEAMALRDTKVIAASTTRRMAHVVFSADVKGLLHRIVCAASAFNVYAMRLFVQVFGTYLLGGKGEFYLSDPLDFGSERVKLFKEIELRLDNANNTVLTLETDQPGGALATRFSTTIAATSGEQSIKVRLPNTVKGRTLRLKLAPTADCAAYSIRAWLKTIGEPNAGPWTWIPLPLTPTQDAIWVSVPVPVDEI